MAEEALVGILCLTELLQLVVATVAAKAVKMLLTEVLAAALRAVHLLVLPEQELQVKEVMAL